MNIKEKMLRKMKEKNNSSLNSFDDSNFSSISQQKNSNLVPKLNLKQIEFNKIYNETNFQKSFSKISSTLTSKSVENRINKELNNSIGDGVSINTTFPVELRKPIMDLYISMAQDTYSKSRIA